MTSTIILYQSPLCTVVKVPSVPTVLTVPVATSTVRTCKRVEKSQIASANYIVSLLMCAIRILLSSMAIPCCTEFSFRPKCMIDAVRRE